MRTRLRIVVLGLLVVLGALLPAAPGRAGPDEDALAAAIALYDDLEFETAIPALRAALARPSLGRDARVAAYRHLALSCVALGRDAEARDAFRALLALDPRYRLPRTDSPRALDLFEEVRGDMPELRVRLTGTASPARPSQGSPVVVTIAAIDEDGLLERVVVHHRTRGGRAFSRVQAARLGAGRFGATIPGLQVGRPALEYYVVGLGRGGAVLAREGDETSPLELPVGAPAARARPITGRWWFWAGVGGAAVAATVAGIVLATGGGEEPATVVVTVQPPGE